MTTTVVFFIGFYMVFYSEISFQSLLNTFKFRYNSRFTYLAVCLI